MNLYYTVSSAHDAIQTDARKSLGGFKSSTVPSNDEFNNLFFEISTLTIRNDKAEYIALMLKNELGADVTGAKLWIETNEGCYSAFEVAGVLPSINALGFPVMERVRTRNSRPFVGDFVTTSELEPLEIGDIAEDATVGLWFKRSLLIDDIKADQLDVYEVDPTNSKRYVAKQKDKQDTVTIKISWD